MPLTGFVGIERAVANSEKAFKLIVPILIQLIKQRRYYE